MKTTTNETAKQVYESHVFDVRCLLELIEDQLNTHAEIATSENNWGYVGDMSRVIEHLEIALGALGYEDDVDDERYVSLGAKAFAAGHKRIVPRDVLVRNGAEAARAWYRGWDAANLAAPVDDADADIKRIIAEYERVARGNRPDWNTFIDEAKHDPAGIAYETYETAHELGIDISGNVGGVAIADALWDAALAWVDALTK